MLNAKIIFSSVLLTGLTAAGGWFYIDHKITTAVDQKLQEAVDNGQYQALTYDDLHYGLNGEVSLYNLQITQANVDYLIDEIHITSFDSSHEFPHELSFSIKGLRLPDGLPASSISGGTALNNYLSNIKAGERIPLQIQYSHTYQPEQALLFQPSLKLSISDFLDLDINSTIHDLDLDALLKLRNASPDPVDAIRAQVQMNSIIEQAAIESLQITLADSGAVQVYMEMGAEQMQLSVKDYREIISSQARSLHMFLPEHASELAKTYGEQLSAFLEGQRTLSLSMHPQLGGSIQRLQPQLMGAALTGDFQFMVDILDLQLLTR